jgi:hypothetical protein
VGATDAVSFKLLDVEVEEGHVLDVCRGYCGACNHAGCTCGHRCSEAPDSTQRCGWALHQWLLCDRLAACVMLQVCSCINREDVVISFTHGCHEVYSNIAAMTWLLCHSTCFDRSRGCRTKLGQGAFKPVAGLRPVSVPGVEDMDFTSIVSSHSDWTKNLSRVLFALHLSGRAT